VSTEAEYRLPRTVTPTHYDITLAPVLDDAVFSGTVTVQVDIGEPVSEIVLNAVDLEITHAVLRNDAGAENPATVTFDPGAERATLTLETPAEPGAWHLETEFTGILNDQLVGFYRSTYRNQTGQETTIATTQFEATDARRAFPCWDEPDIKATYDVTLIVAEGLLAISNAAEVGREPLGNGTIAVRYATTMKMSTYLLAFVVGDLVATHPVDVDGTPLRIVHQPGQEHLTGFALEMGAHALRYFSSYYGIPYPGDKLDMIAIPDFAWGAMENLGAITYRETALLVDREKAAQADLMRVADVIAHEIAHMWFGDLVTMKWWNGIWLNEAFATFAEMKCVDAFRPDWKRWLAFSASRASSMHTDALASTRPIEFPVASPDEANQMFDVLTYQKGSSVLRMLERYLGEEAFRTGVSRYLNTHAYGNTETADLWAALEEASGEPVGEIMDGWIFHGGFPVVIVDGEAGRYTFTQRQFRYLGEGEGAWQVPLLVTTADGPARHVLTDAQTTLDLGADLVVNAGGDGFYRVEYSPALAADLKGRIDQLGPEERYGLVADTWASVLRGDTRGSEFLALAGSLQAETEVDVWAALFGGLGELDRIVSSDDRPQLQRFVRDLAVDRFDDLGWSPDSADSDRTRQLRGLLIRALGNLGADPEMISAARSVWEQVEAGTACDAEVRDAALGVVSGNGSLEDLDHFLAASDAADSPQDTVKYLRAATAIPEPEAARRLFARVLDGEVRSQDSMWVLALMLGHRENGPVVWELLKEHWDAALATMPPQNKRRMLDLLPYRSEPDVAADIESWLAAHPIPGADAFTAQQLELLRVRVGLREREADGLKPQQ